MPHVCIPSGCQQWVSKTIAVGIDKFAYMSSLAIYVYSSITYLPLAILAKHEERLAALALSPFDSNLLACAIGNQEVRIYDVDTELPVCRAKYTVPKGKVSVMEWHQMHRGVLLLAIGPALLRTISLSDAAATSAAGLAGIGPASAVCWEPLSGNGLLLIVGRSGSMALYDTTAGEVVLSYSKQPATATRFAQFLPSQPGNFLLSSSRSGALQLWNVSRPQPLRPLQMGGTLVQGFALMRTTAGGGRGEAAAAARSPQRTAVLVSFSDGAVLWRQEGGHTETVFDCRFCPTDPNLLATASFDSTVRVWDVRSSRCVKHLLGAEGILYSVSWSADGRHIAASNDSGAIFLYDYGRGSLAKTLRQHTKQSLKVAFHPHKPSLLASASTDGTVLVYNIDGETLLVGTSGGGELLLWDVSRPHHDCLVRTLVGHNGRSFNVEFSPLLRNYLLSSSNDRTSRVWDVSSGECLAVLSGHTAVVRAVAWHPEVAHICFTGSWDASVRVWDIRTGHCLYVANDHHADVYGIACHPRRPFFLATCSRDNTVRLWSTLGLTSHLLPQALIRGLPALRAQPSPSRSSSSSSLESEAAVLPLSSPTTAILMSGSGSLELSERLAAPSCSPLEQFAAVTEFFMPPGVYARLGSGAARRDELLREAAQQHLLAGNVEHSCELLAEVGEWDRALALAPAVGLALWQRLLRQRLQAMAEAEAEMQSLRPPMLTPLQLSASASAVLASPSSPRNPPLLSLRPDSPPASTPFGVDAGPVPLLLPPASPPLALTPTHTPAAPSSPRAPTPPTSTRVGLSPTIRQSRGAAAAAAGGGGGGGSGPTRLSFERAVAVRMAQARAFLARGLPLQAACCALTVDDLAGAVGMLLRGGLEDMALALVQGLSRPATAAAAAAAAAAASGGGGGGAPGCGAFGVGLESSRIGSGGGGGGAESAAAAAALLRPRVLAAAAYRREAAGDYLTAAELIKQLASRVFGYLGLREPGQYAAAAEVPGAVAVDAAAGWEGVRRLLLAGQQAAAADRALAGVRRLLEADERVSLLSSEWELAWGAVNSLEASALGGAVWSRVFSHAVYLGALLCLEQGCAAAGLYLVRVLEDWAAKQPSRLAAEVSEALDECLALPAYGSPGEVREALLELLLAPPGSAWLQGVIQSRLASVEARLPSTRGSATTPPPGRSIRSPPHQPRGGGGGGGSAEGPVASSSSFCANRLCGVTSATASAAAAGVSLAALSRGPVVVVAAHVPSRSSSSMVASGGLPTSAVSGTAIRGAAVQLDDGATWLSLSEALAIRRVMSYSPVGSGRLLLVP
ncbi:hypothetical protein VOLCADRAFT_115828 [Volvox carteri f. nagariensis]|uniref:Uncharacterized protein n=1 Tax=Volvox carteri f. nagariensis TaxID=3068 RepID=D8TIJ7_VOLCA|nr:uncharacterized protein VOLCADRAFT_115828 [Volvox carteri f. nagariensis]EFJ53255.1 hypothetical protein VOLCADRAFT_115828 [Volvox carteri f. nagariensis]|eukprot:XP_002946260.1 hypothetical protein VOLCADRAFT_115828 [Volvox carteri f. nagariensis]